jgi:hypothetical protein
MSKKNKTLVRARTQTCTCKHHPTHQGALQATRATASFPAQQPRFWPFARLFLRIPCLRRCLRYQLQTVPVFKALHHFTFGNQPCDQPPSKQVPLPRRSINKAACTVTGGGRSLQIVQGGRSLPGPLYACLGFACPALSWFRHTPDSLWLSGWGVEGFWLVRW